jgi:hypothetical protein
MKYQWGRLPHTPPLYPHTSLRRAVSLQHQLPPSCLDTGPLNGTLKSVILINLLMWQTVAYSLAVSASGPVTGLRQLPAATVLYHRPAGLKVGSVIGFIVLF